MRTIDILLDLENKGLLKKLYCSGVISSNMLLYKEIYLYVNAQQSLGVNQMKIISDTEDKFHLGQTTIYKAIKLMSA